MSTFVAVGRPPERVDHPAMTIGVEPLRAWLYDGRLAAEKRVPTRAQRRAIKG